MAGTREHDEVIRLLKAHGAKLERTKKHNVWRFPDGHTQVVPQTPSCPRAWKNQLADLKKSLGLNGVKGTPGERRAKKRKRDRQKLKVHNAATEVILHDLKSELAKRRTEPVKEMIVEWHEPLVEEVTLPAGSFVPVSYGMSILAPQPEIETIWEAATEAMAKQVDADLCSIDGITPESPTASPKGWRAWLARLMDKCGL